MSTLKRKPQTAKSAADSASKRQKLDTNTKQEPRNGTTVPSTKTVPTKSVLAKEQPAFPRGGAGPLTLLEKKQIRRDAAREVNDPGLFDGQTNDKANSDESDLDLDENDVKQTFATKKSKKQKKKTATSQETDAVAIESVSYRRLAEGSLLLGRISHVSSQELTLALPNNLTGFVPSTAISAQFSSKMEKALREGSDDEVEDEEQENENNIDLRRHFRTGQALRVAVRTTENDADNKKEIKKRIDLSIQPSSVNKGLSRELLVPGITLQVAVSSVEDHGVVVDLGFEDGSTGFIAKKGLPTGIQLADVELGSVYLCTTTNVNPKGKIIQLSADLTSNTLAKTASSVDAYLPGTLVEVLLTQVSQEGLAGKVLGLLDVTADFLHSTAFQHKDNFIHKFEVGQKVTARLIANFPLSDNKKLAFSLTDAAININDSTEERLELSSTVDRAQVVSVAHGLGVYFSLPSQALGFAHVSRLSDKTVENLSEISGPFKKGTEHQARIVDYNAVDGLYILSLQKSILEQPYLRLADVEVGAVVKGSIEKVLVSENGVRGLLVKIATGITGHVSPNHQSDVALKNPEKKFREGMSVKTRVLAVDTDRRRLDLTLKKTLVNSDQPIWASYEGLEPGQSTVGTLIKVDTGGAIVQFYGSVKGRLPVSEMSEAFVKDAREHFKAGQVLTVYILKVDAEAKRLTLTARDTSTVTRNDTTSLSAGSLVSGTVFEKSADDLMLRLEPSGSIARLFLDHISDGSEKKRKSALEKIRVGQKMENVLVFEVKGRSVNLSNKASLRKAAEEGKLLKSYEQLVEDMIVTGYVSNITENRVFVKFAQGITGVINRAQIPDDQASLPEFGMKVLQAVSAKVVNIDYKGATPRFWLSMKADSTASGMPTPPAGAAIVDKEVIEAVDENVSSYSDFSLGAVVKARITSVRETQLNVELAKGIQGRVDVSEIFDSLDEIKDRKHPLKQFSTKQILNVKILGQHDSRTYKFLPLSHRTSKNVVFELSARPSVVSGKQPRVLTFEDMKVGATHPVFVNNVSDHALMVNVSPAVRGRIKASDVSDDLSLGANLSRNFPVGSVLNAQVIAVDIEKNRLDLSSKSGAITKALTLDSLSAGDIVAGRITKITDRSLMVQLSEDLAGLVELVDMADDYDLANTTRFEKNSIVRAYVTQVDTPNKKVFLSLRPSKILSSGLDAKDPELSLQDLNVGDVRRGFVSNVAEKGLFVTLARGLTAFVRVTNLSDEYLKEWKEHFQKDQLVQGKIVALDKDSGHIQMSLRKSHVDGNYKPPLTFNDLNVGDVVEAKVAKVETFGVFIVVANSENVRGLCHRSEIAEKRIEDVTKLGFAEGDTVKAKVLKIDTAQRRINFGMKASYFGDFEDEEEDDDEMLEVDQAESAANDDEEVSEGEGVELDVASGLDDAEDVDDDSEGVELNPDGTSMEVDEAPKPTKGLSVGGFDWHGMPATNSISTKRAADSSDEGEKSKAKKRKKKPEIMVDRTEDLDKDGPQSVDDFERLLSFEPDSAQLWIQFIAFHMDLGDVDAAHEVAEKALKSIGLAQQTEKQAIWVALLNLENAFGDDASVEATLQRACQTMDAEDMHSKLASIYIQSGKHEKADDLFQNMTKKFTQSPKLWINYATFLFDKLEEPARARALLPRALQALPPFTHFDITKRFAQLEFKTKTGVPEEGRTRFQGLVNLYPRRLDLFNIMLDLEMRLGDADQVRGVFEQVLSKNIKAAKAKPFFSRWMQFEEKQGDQKKVEEVQARAAKWVQQYQKTSS